MALIYTWEAHAGENMPYHYSLTANSPAGSGDDPGMRAERCPHEPERVLVGDRHEVLTGERPGGGMAEHGPVAAGLPVTEPPGHWEEVQPPAVDYGAERSCGTDVGTTGDRCA